VWRIGSRLCVWYVHQHLVCDIPLQVDTQASTSYWSGTELAALQHSPWFAFAFQQSTLLSVWGNHAAVKHFGKLKQVNWGAFVMSLTGMLSTHMEILLEHCRWDQPCGTASSCQDCHAWAHIVVCKAMCKNSFERMLPVQAGGDRWHRCASCWSTWSSVASNTSPS
jgi:hypothetical protein